MTQAVLLPFQDSLTEVAPARDATATLSTLGAGETASVLELALEPEMAGWLRAVGISERERVTVLRRGAFGGPIHVRTSAGGEFALHRSLAMSVLMRRVAPDREPPP